MEVTKADYVQWRTDPVTKMFVEEMLVLVDSEIANLLMQAGLNPLADRHRVGRIDGLKEVAEWEPDFREDKDGIDSEGA